MRPNEAPISWPDKAGKHNAALLSEYASLRGLPTGSAIPLGCGKHGCAYQIGERYVLKITSDETEARFAQVMCNQPRPINGIIRYYHVVQLRGNQVDKAGQPTMRTYAIWRDLARDVGKLLEIVRGDSEEAPLGHHTLWWLAEYVSNYKRASSAARTMVKETGHEGKDLRARLDNAWPRASRFYSQMSLSACDSVPLGALRQLPALERIGVLLAHCERVAEELGRLAPSTKALGDALTDGMRAGLLLCDVHLKNVGRHLELDRWLVTDPGHILSLGPDLSAIWIPKL